jgi:hypothetical protein
MQGVFYCRQTLSEIETCVQISAELVPNLMKICLAVLEFLHAERAIMAKHRSAFLKPLFANMFKNSYRSYLIDFSQ